MAHGFGGDRVGPALRSYAEKLGNGPRVKVGFLSGATYPNGTPVPLIAAVMEFGATINAPEREQTIYRDIDLKTGDFRNAGRFVKAKKANFATIHHVAAHQITIPPRPYFRNMIAEKSGTWAATLGALLKSTGMQALSAMRMMGEEVKGQLQESIQKLSSPPLARSTIRQKGFAKPLVRSGHLLNSVDYSVEGGDE